MLGQRDPEIVRKVAFLASDATVERSIRSRDLVAAAACAGQRLSVFAAWVRVVAPDARLRAYLGVIGMHCLVAPNACGVADGTNVVRCVTALAASVSRHVRSAEDMDFLVAGTA